MNNKSIRAKVKRHVVDKTEDKVWYFTLYELYDAIDLSLELKVFNKAHDVIDEIDEQIKHDIAFIIRDSV